MYQELLTNDCLVMFGTAQLLDLLRVSLRHYQAFLVNFLCHGFGNAPFRKNCILTTNSVLSDQDVVKQLFTTSGHVRSTCCSGRGQMYGHKYMQVS